MNVKNVVVWMFNKLMCWISTCSAHSATVTGSVILQQIVYQLI